MIFIIIFFGLFFKNRKRPLDEAFTFPWNPFVFQEESAQYINTLVVTSRFLNAYETQADSL